MTTAPGPGARPSTVEHLLRTVKADPGRPRLTWYGPAGERIELSGHVLDNWVAKTVNLLVDEYDVGPGAEVVVDLPVHWRTLVWSLAVWRAGGCVALAAPGGPTGDVSLVVTHRPEQWTAADVVAVPLPALARRFDGILPPGATDGAAAVMSHGDVIGWAPATDLTAPALRLDGTVVSHAELFAWAAATSAADGGRVLALPAGPAPATSVGTALTLWAADGSLVLCSPDVAAELAADPARTARLVETERVTGTTAVQV